jgi:hypothetical protein
MPVGKARQVVPGRRQGSWQETGGTIRVEVPFRALGYPLKSMPVPAGLRAAIYSALNATPRRESGE